MKIKNIIKIATLTGLIATGSAYSMQAALLNGVKACIRYSGTAIGLGLMNAKTIEQTSALAVSYANPQALKNSVMARNVSPEEEAFIKENITQKTSPVYCYTGISSQVASIKGSFSSADGAIYIDESSIAPRHINYENENLLEQLSKPRYVSLNEALKTNNEEAKKSYLAVLQHEDTHVAKKHPLQLAAFKSGFASLASGGTYFTLKKYIPSLEKPAPMHRYLERFNAKIIGGAIMGLFINTATLYAAKPMHHYIEYQADRGVAPENREAMIKLLDATRTKHPDLAFDNFTHPAVPKRIQRLQKLQQQENKQS